MWKWAVVASTATVVGEMYTKWHALRCRIVGQLTGVGVVGAVALQEVPAYGDLGCIMSVHARKTAATGTCGRREKMIVNGYHTKRP